MSSLRPSRVPPPPLPPPAGEFRDGAGQPAGPTKEIPLWTGVLLGLLVAAAILGVVVSMRAKRTATAQTASPAVSVVRPAPSTLPLASASGSAQPPAPPVDKVVVHPVVHPAPSSSVGKTQERVAVDALHSGDVRRAADLYAELAAANPQNPALVEMARQLAKAKSSTAKP